MDDIGSREAKRPRPGFLGVHPEGERWVIHRCLHVNGVLADSAGVPLTFDSIEAALEGLQEFLREHANDAGIWAVAAPQFVDALDAAAALRKVSDGEGRQ